MRDHSALAVTRQALPDRTQWRRLAGVGGGVVIGFPLLTSYALVTAPAAHGAMVMAVLRGKEQPSPIFWVAAIAGAVTAVVFASVQVAA